MNVTWPQTCSRDEAERTATTPKTAHCRHDDAAVSAFIAARPRLFSIAYQTLGSVADTEDVIQEAWLRWQRTDREVVVNPTAFLATTTARLALNSALSARRRHETGADPDSLERADPDAGPETRVERSEAVAQALLLVLQKLTPMELAAYVLREAFDYPHQRIAEILRINATSARQLLVRAHRHIATRPHRPVARAAHRRLLRGFLDAVETGEIAALEALLATDAIGAPCRRRCEVPASSREWQRDRGPGSYDPRASRTSSPLGARRRNEAGLARVVGRRLGKPRRYRPPSRDGDVDRRPRCRHARLVLLVPPSPRLVPA